MDYATMSDVEMRVEIAKRKGLRTYWLSGNLCHNMDPIPDWPTDISAAWGLVEEMRGAGSVSVHTQGAGWQCSFEVHGYVRYPTDTIRPGDVFANAPTAPRAICIAWLQWKDAHG